MIIKVNGKYKIVPGLKKWFFLKEYVQLQQKRTSKTFTSIQVAKRRALSMYAHDWQAKPSGTLSAAEAGVLNGS